MPDADAARPLAALDVGSNTIRLLVARPHNHSLQTVLDDSRFVRLGAAVDSSGNLDPKRQIDAMAAIRDLTQRAREVGADPIAGVATSAVRDARNGENFVRQVRAETGVQVRIISGDQEARLTYLGATLGIDLDGGAIISDIGGGSSEVIYADEDGIRRAHSIQIGSGRLTERFVHHDPPTADERGLIVEEVEKRLEELPCVSPRLAVFTGGTASHVARLAGCSGTTASIEQEKIAEVERLIYDVPSREVAERYQIRLERAEVLPAGVTIMRTIATWTGADGLCITRNGIREGVIVDSLIQAGVW